MPKRKIDVIITAQAVIVRRTGQPDAAYYTAEGASIRLHELREQPGEPHPHTAQRLTQEGKLLPDGYLQGLVPVYSEQNLRKVAAGLRSWKRRPVSEAHPEMLSAVQVADEGDTANPDAE